ncbi:hypothetical protein B0H12DRAFT_1096232 [Mycena haematopus]|nr:hypothetical protein B0H12DRAFT_1096232 [Mycena haematopus]
MPPRKKGGKSIRVRKSLEGNGPLLNLPMDILLEIFKIVHPLGLLYLSRSNKALRAFLLNRRSAEFIWRASFELVEDSPPKPPSYSNLVEWTRLLFEEVCHVCCTTLEHDYSFDPIWWEFGARYCSDCCTDQLLATKLPKKLTGSSAARLPALWRDVFPLVHGYRGFMAKYSVSSAADQITLIQERRNRTKELIDHAKISRPWMNRIVLARSNEMNQLKDARWAAIKIKFCEAGWRASLIYKYQWDRHDLVNIPRPLTDAEWNKIGPKLLKEVEDTARYPVMRGRFQTLERTFFSRLTQLTQPLAFSPRMVDIALLPDVRSVLEGNLKLEVTVDDLKAALDSKLPDLLAAWSSALEARLRDHTRAALKLPSDVNPFKFALAYFICEHRCCQGHFTGKAKLCRAGYYNYHDEPETYEDLAAEFLNCKPYTVEDMFRLGPACRVLPDVIRHYGKDPQTATCEEMDAAPGKLWCMRCVLKNQPTGWRDAVAHSIRFHEHFSALKARWEVEIEDE